MIPRHEQIRAHLVAQIHSGQIKPGDRIPSESTLGGQFGVSRPTVQRAVRTLVAEGLLRRVQGSGTFVMTPSHSFSLVEVRDLVEQIRAQGGNPRSEVLIQRRFVADADLAQLFEVEPGAELFQAQVLQSMDDEPVAHEERIVLPLAFPDFLEQDFGDTTIFAYLASRSALGDIENVVRAIHPSRRLAQLLDIASNEPCIQVQRRNWWHGAMVTLTRITYAGGRQELASRYKPFTR